MSNMVVNTNVLALNAHRNMGNVGRAQSQASARLSSGLRINSAADDAAGLAISEQMRSQINGLNQASRNSQDGISLLQTAEGGLTEIQNMVQRTRELVVQAANDTNQASDRELIQLEVIELLDEMEEMMQRVEFNGMNLLNMPAGESTVNIQVGANAGQQTIIDFDFGVEAMINGLRETMNLNVDPNGDLIPDASGEIGFANWDSAQISDMLGSVPMLFEGDGETWDNTHDLWFDPTSAGVAGVTLTGEGDEAELLAAFTAHFTSNSSSFDADELSAALIAAQTAMTAFNTATNGLDPVADAAAITTASTAFNASIVAANGSLSGTGTTAADPNATAADLGIDGALVVVSEARATLGASENRLDYTISSLDISSENLSASESRIRDADMGQEMMNLTQANVLQQAAMSMLSQANQAPQQILQLLR